MSAPARLVDLDALARGEKHLVRWAPPRVVDGEIVTDLHQSPLDPDVPGGPYPTALRGGVVTDPDVIAAIRARTDRAALVLSEVAAFLLVLALALVIVLPAFRGVAAIVVAAASAASVVAAAVLNVLAAVRDGGTR